MAEPTPTRPDGAIADLVDVEQMLRVEGQAMLANTIKHARHRIVAAFDALAAAEGGDVPDRPAPITSTELERAADIVWEASCSAVDLDLVGRLRAAAAGGAVAVPAVSALAERWRREADATHASNTVDEEGLDERSIDFGVYMTLLKCANDLSGAVAVPEDRPALWSPLGVLAAEWEATADSHEGVKISVDPIAATERIVLRKCARALRAALGDPPAPSPEGARTARVRLVKGDRVRHFHNGEEGVVVDVERRGDIVKVVLDGDRAPWSFDSTWLTLIPAAAPSGVSEAGAKADPEVRR